MVKKTLLKIPWFLLSTYMDLNGLKFGLTPYEVWRIFQFFRATRNPLPPLIFPFKRLAPRMVSHRQTPIYKSEAFVSPKGCVFQHLRQQKSISLLTLRCGTGAFHRRKKAPRAHTHKMSRGEVRSGSTTGVDDDDGGNSLGNGMVYGMIGRLQNSAAAAQRRRRWLRSTRKKNTTRADSGSNGGWLLMDDFKPG